MEFKNLLEVSEYFSDRNRAQAHLIKLRWNDKPTCPYCKHDKIYTLQKANKRFKCAKCRGQFSAIKGTIFENSAISLQKWFVAIYLHTSHKKGISSHQLSKDISVTQKSAWFMLQRIRFALESGTFEHSPDGSIQVDETYVGGKEKNRHKSFYSKRLKIEQRRAQGLPLEGNQGRSLDDKTPVVGMVETGGLVKASKVPNTKGETLRGFITDNVKQGATIVTDDNLSYRKIAEHYRHEIVNHSIGQYENNGFHTNGIENFWSQMKRGIYGIYHQVSDKHLDKYIDEFEFRFNNRKMGEAERFNKFLSLCNRRLTYPQLIQKEK